MQKNPTRGVQPDGHRPEPLNQGLRDWGCARSFLEVARAGSLRSASQSLGISVNTLRHQIDEFEREVGTKLLTRHVDGVRLTEEGRQLLSSVKRMETASFEIARVRSLGTAVHGEVRISVTEGLGTFWIAPRLVEFQRAYPSLLIDMRCTMHPADVLRLESDIAIQITRPDVKDLRIVKLGRLHAMPFASPEYIEAFGCPKTVADLEQHRLVLQVADQITSEEEFARLFGDAAHVGLVAFRHNVSSAHYWVIARGGGIGMLPTYAQQIGGRVVPVDIPGVRIAQDIWLSYHADAGQIPRVRRVIDWLVDCFSAKKYPWFGDDFVHPAELPKTVGSQSMFSLFEGIEEVSPVPAQPAPEVDA